MPTTKQRRETARRRLERQLQRRQEAAIKRRRRNVVTAAAFGVVVVLGAVFLLVTLLDDGTDNPPAAAPTPTASAAAKGECTYTAGGEAVREVGLPANGKVPTTGTVTVNLATNRGTVSLALDRAKAPCAVASFVHLTGKKYFDGSPCHRLTTGAGLRVLQCGDPSGTGQGGPGYTFADEVSEDQKYTKGVVAMANSGANTNGSQFFLVYADSQLPPQYTVFGRVSKGLDVVEKVARAGSDNSSAQGDGKPKLAVQIRSARVAT